MDIKIEQPSGHLVIPSQMSEEQFDYYFPIPDEFLRPSSGSSVLDITSVTDDSGRTYHGYKEGKYMLPNDAAEQDRLDFQHKMVSIILDGQLTLAPFKQTPKYVLDIATGTGIWSIEWAERYPESFVIGTDLSAIQPENHPPNVEFIKEDAEEDWLFPQVPAFDLIHIRFVCMSFDDPRKVLGHVVKNLAKGGYVEYHDSMPFDIEWMNEGKEGPTIKKWCKLMSQALIQRGRDPLVTGNLPGWMQDYGLINVKETKLRVPGNTWPVDRKLKRIGQYMCTDICDGIRGSCWQLFKSLGMSSEEIEQFVLDFKREAKDERNKFFWTMRVIYGMKPFQEGG